MKTRGTKRKYHYFYKITNLVNNHFYYGVHNTDNLDDGYMGSGTRLRYAYKKYGTEFFKKEILKFFNTAEEAFNYEAEVVTEELVHDTNCYNVSCGGGSWKTLGTTVVKDKDGNMFRVGVDDPRYLSGELKQLWCGKHHTQETIEKYHETFKRIKHQQGKRNSNYGNCWVMKDGHSLRIPKNEVQKYLDEGWQKGRKCGNDNYINVNKDNTFKLIHKDKLQKYLDDGWKKGRGKNYYKRLESDIK